MNIVFIFDAVGLVFVLCSISIVIVNRVKKRHLFPFVTLLGLLSLEFFHFTSNALEWSGTTSRFDAFEDFITVVQPVIWGFFLNSFFDMQITKDLQQTLQEKEVLLKEVHHRVKNNLLTLYSLVNLQQASLGVKGSVSGALEDTKQRIRAMGKVHQMLYQSKDFSQIDFANYIETLVEEMKITYSTPRKEIAVALDLESASLNIETAIPCALIINEALVNAFKHAFPRRREGHIAVSLKRKGDAFELKISDDGIGMPEDLLSGNGKTLGLRLVDMLSKQLSGSVSYKKENGSLFTVTFKKATA